MLPYGIWKNVSNLFMMIHVTTYYHHLPLKYCLIILILLFWDSSVRWFLNEVLCSSHHQHASFSETPHWLRMNPQMLLSFMLKSKDASGPCRNLTFLNSWNLTAQEKVAALPCFAAFMLNSPMLMLDVCDWLLLRTVSTSFGGFACYFFSYMIFCVWFHIDCQHDHILEDAKVVKKFCINYLHPELPVMVVGCIRLEWGSLRRSAIHCWDVTRGY